jgi:hypothetical protein
MKIKRVLIELTTMAVLATAASPNNAPPPTQMVITVRPIVHGDNQQPSPEISDLTVLRGNTPAPILSLERLAGASADMQLFVLLDDSTRTSSLGLQLPELKKFLQTLPAATQVAVGYMRNGSFGQVQAFTVDHAKAAGALRLPAAIPGENGSPYFALSDLAKRWPSKESTTRRAVLMLTDGVDRYYTASNLDDPYVNASIHDALKEGVMVYTIYLRGAGDGRSGMFTNFAQSRLIQVTEETGGYAYFHGFSDPVKTSPFLKDLTERFENQYKVTIEAWNEKGVQPVKLRTDLRGLKIEAPTRIYVR